MIVNVIGPGVELLLRGSAGDAADIGLEICLN
jgi:hypothetical protein